MQTGNMMNESLDTSMDSMYSSSVKFPFRTSVDATTLVSPRDTEALEEALDEKKQEILRCLNGVNEQVDLWQLRQLALTRGGFVNSSIRKRAWPKLVGAHQKILQSDSSSPTNVVKISTASMQLLIKDVAKSVWNVQDHVNLARQREEIRLSKLRTKKVTFNIPALTSAPSGESPEKHPPEKDEEETDPGTFSPNTLCTMETYDTQNSLVTTMPKRPASKNEQKVLFNILTSVLRTVPYDSPYFEDDRYKYFHGLADVAALMLINLESPSLTALVLQRLAEGHFRDAMRNTSASLETALRLVFFPLLNQVDGELSRHISSCMELPSFCMAWVSCWFCQQLTDVRVASRLMDVFIASHASMPIYFSVAFLCHPMNRSKILKTPQNLKAMYNTIRILPLTLMKESLVDQSTDIVVYAVEEMIASSIDYVGRYPPSKLLACSRGTDVFPMVPSVSLLQPLPWWAVAATAPSDYAMLQQAATARRSGLLLPTTSHCVGSVHRYPLARAATAVSTRNVWFYRVVVSMVVFGVMMALSVAAVGSGMVVVVAPSVSVVAPPPPPPLVTPLFLEHVLRGATPSTRTTALVPVTRPHVMVPPPRATRSLVPPPSLVHAAPIVENPMTVHHAPVLLQRWRRRLVRWLQNAKTWWMGRFRRGEKRAHGPLV